MRGIAKFISIVFHPLLFTTYLVILLGLYLPTFLMIRIENIRLVALFIFCFTFILPGINMMMFRFFGNIRSLKMETREERIMPFIFIALTYALITFLFFFKLPFSENFNRLMMISSLLVLAAAVSTFFIKISVHSMAITGLLGILLPLNWATESKVLFWPTFMVTIACGVIMSARLYLNAHTLREVGWGGVVGFAVGFFSMIALY